MTSLTPPEPAPTEVRPGVREYPSKALLEAAEGAAPSVCAGPGWVFAARLGQPELCPARTAPGRRDPAGLVGRGARPDHRRGRRVGRLVRGAALRSRRPPRNAELEVVNAYDYLQVVTPMGIAPGIDREVFEKASRALLEEMVGPASRRAAAAIVLRCSWSPCTPARRGLARCGDRRRPARRRVAGRGGMKGCCSAR